MAAELFITTTERIVDDELERVIYGAGDRVPLADAVRLGLVSEAEGKRIAKEAGDDWPKANVAQEGRPAAKPAKAAPPKKAAPKKAAAGKKGPAEDRAKKPAANR